MVSISACHADDPGSIPGRGVLLSSAASRLFVPRCPSAERYPASVQANGQCSLAVERLLRKQKVAGSIPVVGFFHCSPENIFPLPTNKYSVPGLNWGPLACEASVITTRPTELGAFVKHFWHAFLFLEKFMRKCFCAPEFKRSEREKK